MSVADLAATKNIFKNTLKNISMNPPELPAVTPPATALGLLEIDLAAIAANWRRAQAREAPGQCAAVVKADAYGLGVRQVVPALIAAGCRWFFVAQIDEAIDLRASLPSDVRVAILGGINGCAEAAETVRAFDLIPVLNDPGSLAQWQAVARGSGASLPAFLHLDTGMNRLGFMAKDYQSLASSPDQLDGIELLASMTHLASANSHHSDPTRTQIARFEAMAHPPSALGRSLANSSALFHPDVPRCDLARPGCALYGVNPTPGQSNPMQAVVTLWARVMQVRTITAGEAVGYGGDYIAPTPRRIATLGIGYADGLHRLSQTAAFWFGTHRAPIAGRISMDLITVDVTDVPETALARGWARVLGLEQGVDDLADHGRTIGYEVLTGLGRRYPRHYAT